MLMLSSLVLGQNNKQVEDEILKLEKEWMDAFFHADIEAMNRIEADDYYVLHSGTQIPRTKAEQLTIIKSWTEDAKKQMAAATRTLDHIKVRKYGNVIVINAVQTETYPSVKVPGKILNRKALYTGVWVKRNSRWQIINAQFTDLPEQKPQGGN
jgi:ketosteroid isomerase-like protein